MEKRRTKVLVTGADGVLGSNLVRELLDRQYDVSVFLFPGSKSQTLDGLKIKRYYGNILNTKDLDQAFFDQHVVIHAAANTSVFPARSAKVREVNIEGTRNIIMAVKKHGIDRLIYVGSANAFSKLSGEAANECGDYEAHVYGLDYMDSKKEAQDIVLWEARKNELPALVVNPTFMLGAYDSGPSSGKMLLALKNGKLPGYTCGGKNYIHVKDAANAIANAIEKGRIGECYILGNENLTYQEAFAKMAAVMGAKTPSRQLSSFLVLIYGKFNSLLAAVIPYKPSVTAELARISCDTHYYNSEKARKELDLESTPLEVAIQDCYDWFQQNEYL